MNIMNTIALPRQTNVSETIRVSIKRLASNNGGLARFLRGLGQPYKRTWERLNRNQGDLIDLVVALAKNGLDEPLRTAVSATPYELTPKLTFLRKAHPGKAVRSHALDLHHSCSTVTMIIERALLDGRFDDRERDQVLSALHGLRKNMAELELRISGDDRS